MLKFFIISGSSPRSLFFLKLSACSKMVLKTTSRVAVELPCSLLRLSPSGTRSVGKINMFAIMCAVVAAHRAAGVGSVEDAWMNVARQRRAGVGRGERRPS